jgi:putative zinc finger/helix-turn-helix YgiT family protein
MTDGAPDLFCVECGSDNLREETCAGTHEVKGREVEIPADRHFTCEVCGEWNYPGELAGQLQEQIAAALRKRDGLCSLEELKSARLIYGFTQAEMDILLGAGDKSWVRWERGRVPPSPATDKTIRRFLNEPEFVGRLMDQTGVDNPAAREVIDTAVRRARAHAATAAAERLPNLPAAAADEIAASVVDAYQRQMDRSFEANPAAQGDDWMAVIKRHAIRTPVDVDAIARDLGIRVLRDPNLGKNISGKIQRDPMLGGRSGYVMYVNRWQAPVRQRFTVAHEIAHFGLHRDRIGNEMTEDALYRGPFSTPQEREANRFAGEMLIPEEAVREAFKKETRISVLAKRFETSEDTMRIRLEQLGLIRP